MAFLLDEIKRTYVRNITIEKYTSRSRIIEPSTGPGPWSTSHILRVSSAGGYLDSRQLFESADAADRVEAEVRHACSQIGVKILA
jgi:hypothetical protein